uniref:Solute carrier family 26 member 6 n=1 Tax=Xenopus tropicalis TaxID=8364 RepID=F7A8I9_XENTR
MGVARRKEDLGNGAVMDPAARQLVLSEAELEEIAPRSQRVGPSTLARMKKRIRCSGSIAKSLLLKFIPILGWIPRYPVREWLLGDIVAGLSVGIIQLPQGLAYALLAGVPPVYGLYSSFFPVLLYAIFGTSRHISPGTFAVISVMVGSVTESLVPSELYTLPGNETLINITARDNDRVAVASALTFLVGLFQIMLGLVQVGFVVTYLSEPLIRGYTSAAAIHVTVSQMKSVLGVQISQRSHPLSLIYAIVNLCAKLPETNIASLLIGGIAITVLFVVKFLNDKYSSKIRMPIPIELITLIVATGISYGANLNQVYGVDIVGEIPTGMKAPMVPNASIFASVVGNAFAIAVVVYAFTISLAKMFAVKHGYNVDSNQELIALGLSNSIGSFFQCFTIGTAMSRSLVQESTGGHSQVASAVSSLVILIIILRAGELFQTLPKLVWVVTFLATILLNLDIGLAVSVAFSLLTVIFRTQKPHYSILGKVDNTDIYRDVAQFDQVTEIQGIKIFRSSCTLYFANANLYAESVKRMCGAEVDKLIELKKKAIKKQKQLQEKAEKQRKKENKRKEKELDSIVSNSPAAKEPEIQIAPGYEALEDAGLDYFGSEKCTFHSLILDLSTAGFLDTVSIKVLKNIFRDFQEIDVQVYLTGCQVMYISRTHSRQDMKDSDTCLNTKI